MEKAITCSRGAAPKSLIRPSAVFALQKLENPKGFQPYLVLEAEEPLQLGKYGRMRRNYLKEHRQGMYNELILEGKLNRHLAEIEETAYDYYDRLSVEMAKAEGVTEQLKAQNQLLWVQKMNSIRDRVDEIIQHELIYS